MGFDTTLFLTQPVDDSLLCSICAGVFEKPRTACSNGHVYCEECLDRTKAAMGSSCPDCRGQMLDPLPPSRTVIGIIDKMKLNCEFSKSPQQVGEEQPSSRRRVSENGAAVVEDDANNRTLCGWQGLASNYREHTNTCDYRLVDCPLICDQKVPFILLEQHQSYECVRRRVSCTICNRRVRFCDLEMHATSFCPEVDVTCQWCQEVMKRKELGYDRSLLERDVDSTAEDRYTGHYETCPKILLPCEFSSLGCKLLIAREDKARHHVDMAVAHARLLGSAIDQDNKTLQWSIGRRYFFQREPISVESPKFYAGGYKFSILLHISVPSLTIRLLFHPPPRTTNNIEIKAFRLRVSGTRLNGQNYENVEGYVPELEKGITHQQIFQRAPQAYYLSEWHPIRIMTNDTENNWSLLGPNVNVISLDQSQPKMTRQMIADFATSTRVDGSPLFTVEMEVKRQRMIEMYSV